VRYQADRLRNRNLDRLFTVLCQLDESTPLDMARLALDRRGALVDRRPPRAQGWQVPDRALRNEVHGQQVISGNWRSKPSWGGWMWMAKLDADSAQGFRG